MAETIVTKQATVAANLDIGISGSRAWDNPDRVLTSDNFYAVADFGADSTSSSARVSDYLYISDFGFDLLSEAKVVGLKVTIERNAVGATVKDYYIGLAYNEDSTLNITSPSKHKSAFWPEGVDADSTYGSSTDFWNKAWTATEINDSEFGIVISTIGFPNLNQAANIDFVEMTIYWHQDIYITPVGGLSGGGTADVDLVYAIEAEDLAGGSIHAGHGSYNHDTHVAAGGSLAAGEYEGAHFYWPLGGTILGGVPIHKVTYYLPDVHLGGIDVNGEAFVWLIDIVEVGGGIQTGGEARAVDFIQPVGGSTVNGDKIFQFTYNYTPSGGVSVGTAAHMNPSWITMDGGLTSSGLATRRVEYDVQTEGGAVAGGQGLRIDEYVVSPFGVSAGGTADFSHLVTRPAEGGVVVADNPGETALIGPQWETMGGGATAAGIPWVGPYAPLGGASLGGTATNTMIMGIELDPNNHWIVVATSYEVYGEEDEDGDRINEDAHGLTSWAHFYLEGADDTSEPNVFKWEIYHKFNQRNAKELQVRVGDPLVEGVTWLQLGALSGSNWANPIIGQKDNINDGRVDKIRNGELYYYSSSHTIPNSERVRAQITTRGAVKCSGSVPQLYTEFPEGGMTASGTSDLLLSHIYYPQGGALVSGRPVFIFSMIIEGGVLVNGSSLRTVSYNFSPSEGAIVNGDAIEVLSYLYAPLGGILTAGRAFPGIQPAIFGGALVSGSIIFDFYYAPVIRGGALAAGLHKQTFTDFYDGIGGAKINGRARAEKIKFFTKQHLGYCYAMASENICTTRTYEHELIPPTSDVSPELDPDRFRIQHVGAWCDVEERCKEGVLPKKVQDRQGEHLPPKLTKRVIRDRRIATLDAV